MAETVAQKRARLEKELADLDVQQSAKMERILERGNEKVRKAIDQTAEELATASKELDGDAAVDADDIRKGLYAQYGIEDSSGVEADTGAGEPPSGDGEAPPADAPSDEGEPPAGPGGEPGPGLEETEDAETAPERDVKPPPRHWSERPIFSGKGD